MNRIYLKIGAEAPVTRRHPWIFSGAVDSVEGNPGSGDLVQVTDHAGAFLATGRFSPQSQIRVRLLEFDPKVTVDRDWYYQRLKEALARRQELVDTPGLTAFRLVHGESDRLPGLIIDYYHPFCLVMALDAGTDRIKTMIAEMLMTLLPIKGVYERSDAHARTMEGLTPSVGVLAGQAPPEHLEITEGGVRYLVQLQSGQKSGFFLDQRENRKLAAKYAKGRSVLDCFAYTGAFGLRAALAGAASVTTLESSADAVALGLENFKLNGVEAPETITGDAFETLRKFRDSRRSFDMIVLDPPKFAPNQASLNKATRAYKDINLLALKLLNPGGILMTFSCSQAVSLDLFQKIVFGASIDAKVNAQIIEYLHQPQDHPTLLSFPEASYLKGLVLRTI